MRNFLTKKLTLFLTMIVSICQITCMVLPTQAFADDTEDEVSVETIAPSDTFIESCMFRIKGTIPDQVYTGKPIELKLGEDFQIEPITENFVSATLSANKVYVLDVSSDMQSLEEELNTETDLESTTITLTDARALNPNASTKEDILSVAEQIFQQRKRDSFAERGIIVDENGYAYEVDADGNIIKQSIDLDENSEPTRYVKDKNGNKVMTKDENGQSQYQKVYNYTTEEIEDMMKPENWTIKYYNNVNESTNTSKAEIVLFDDNDNHGYIMGSFNIYKNKFSSMIINSPTNPVGNPIISVYDGTKKLTEDIDYETPIIDNYGDGTGRVVVTGINNYIGSSITGTFTNGAAPSGSHKFIANNISNKKYPAEKVTNDDIVVKDFSDTSKILSNETDYEWDDISENLYGIRTVQIHGKNDYAGTSIALNYLMYPHNMISLVTFTDINDHTVFVKDGKTFTSHDVPQTDYTEEYTGQPVMPIIYVYDSEYNLIDASNYNVVSENNINVNSTKPENERAKIIITGKEGTPYAGQEKIVYFKIARSLKAIGEYSDNGQFVSAPNYITQEEYKTLQIKVTNNAGTQTIPTTNYDIKKFIDGETSLGDTPELGTKIQFVVEGKGEYEGMSATLNYTIIKARFATFTLKKEVHFNHLLDETYTDIVTPIYDNDNQITSLSINKAAFELLDSEGSQVPTDAYEIYYENNEQDMCTLFTLKSSDAVNYGGQTMTCSLSVYTEFNAICENLDDDGNTIKNIKYTGDDDAENSVDLNSIFITVTDFDTNEPLEYNKDYKFLITPNLTTLKCDITVCGIGKYARSESEHFTNIDMDYIPALKNISYISPKQYTGSAITPDFKVYNALQNIIPEKDEEGKLNYTFHYSNNINAGKATVTVEGQNTYEGQNITAEFYIFKKFTVGSIKGQDYTGYTIMPPNEDVVVKNEDGDLLDISEYTIEPAPGYSNREGTGGVCVSGAENTVYYGCVVPVTFEIIKNLKEITSIDEIGDIYETGKQIRPIVNVLDKDGKEINPKYYTIEYGENISGTGTITITGDEENSTGTLTATFNILKPGDTQKIIASIDEIEDEIYDGELKTPYITVRNKAGRVVNPDKYTIAYSNNLNVGTGTVRVVAINGSGFTGSATQTFKITEDHGIITTLKDVRDQEYTGYPIKPLVSVYNEKNRKVLPDYYTLSYSPDNAVDIGTIVTITATGKKGYANSSAKASYAIKQAKLSTVRTVSGTYKNKGIAVEPYVRVYNTNGYLINPNNYTVTYSNNTTNGTATITVTPNNKNYTGSTSTTFTIADKGEDAEAEKIDEYNKDKATNWNNSKDVEH